MIEQEVPNIIINEFPGMNSILSGRSPAGDVFEVFSIVAEFMKRAVKARRFASVGKYMKLADSIYEDGNAVTRMAIETEFVYSFTLASKLCEQQEWNRIREVIPTRLEIFISNK